MNAILATCPRCKKQYGHPGPCPRCEPTFGPHIQQALDLANEAHRNEWRKGKIRLPYMTHIYDLLKLARHIGITTDAFDVYRAIILHDAVESGFPIERIAAMSTETAEHVMELSFLPNPNLNPHRTANKKAEYMSSFGNKSLIVLVVKVLDRLCNIMDFYEEGDIDYARKYYHKADVLFEVALRQRGSEFVQRFGDSVFNELVAEFGRVTNLLEEIHP